MNGFARTFGRVALLVAALASGGCPPPAVKPVGRASTPAAVGVDPSPKEAPPPSRPTERGTPGAPAQPASAATGEPQAAVASATPKPTAYEHLAGGTYVGRCPSCGAVQPAASVQCVSCGQLLRPWRQEQTCSVCVGSGVCARCGDDRACLDCDGQGACPYCDGTGKLADDKCAECGGNGRCAACGGDGVRESANHDFGPYETVLPGICSTCLGGSGLCPDCGTLTKDSAGGTCLTCGGLGICPDCGGTGLCPHDAGDGWCVVCAGAGREVVDGEPAKAADRVWSLRTESGSAFAGRILGRPDPNVHVQIGGSAAVAYMRSKLNPLSYYRAVKIWTPDADGKAQLELGTIALSCGFWAVAQQDFRRAMAADPTISSEATAQLREIGDRRSQQWLEMADAAKKQGDRDGATLLLSLVRFKAPGTPLATRADVVRIQIQRERDEEEKGLDDAARQRAAEDAKGRVARVAASARLRIDRARKLVDAARKAPPNDPGTERTLARADQAAFSAQRVVQKAAFRDPASAAAWPAKPEALLREARLLRAEIVAIHAAREIGAGRFEFGRRLARRASQIDAANAQAGKLLEQADLGIARRGVLRASPSPIPK
jgi:hypothetical protein